MTDDYDPIAELNPTQTRNELRYQLKLREADRARIAELEAVAHEERHLVNELCQDLRVAEARLAAVIALCDSDLYGDAGSMFAHDVRAAATGEPNA